MALWVKIQCGGEEHTVGLESGKRPIIDQEEHDIELELSLGALGGELPECIKLHSDHTDGAVFAATAVDSFRRGRKWLTGYSIGEQLDKLLEAPGARDKLFAGTSYADYAIDDDDNVAALLRRKATGETINAASGVVTELTNKLRSFIEDEDEVGALELVMLLDYLFEDQDPWDIQEYEHPWDTGVEGSGLIIERHLQFFDDDVAKWDRQWERRCLDEVTFDSYDAEDVCESSGEQCTPDVIALILFALGLEEDEEPEVEEPYLDVRPCDPDEAGEYGVLYEPDKANPYITGNTWDWRKTEVATYNYFGDLGTAMEQSQSLSDLRAEDNLYIMTPVRRVSDKKFAEIVLRVEEDRASRAMFSAEHVKPFTDADYLKMQWEPWTEVKEEALRHGGYSEDDL